MYQTRGCCARRSAPGLYLKPAGHRPVLLIDLQHLCLMVVPHHIAQRWVFFRREISAATDWMSAQSAKGVSAKSAGTGFLERLKKEASAGGARAGEAHGPAALTTQPIETPHCTRATQGCSSKAFGKNDETINSRPYRCVKGASQTTGKRSFCAWFPRGGRRQCWPATARPTSSSRHMLVGGSCSSGRHAGQGSIAD